MAKVVGAAGDILYRGGWLTARAITLPGGDRPAKRWHDSLDKRGKGQVAAAFATLEASLSSGRPPAGRMRKVTTSTQGVSEVRVTKAGGTPPHLRAFVVREDRTLWVATGITKTSNRLDPRDIADADGIVKVWRGERT